MVLLKTSLKPDIRTGAVFSYALTCPMARLVEKVTSGIRFPSNTYFFAIKWAKVQEDIKTLGEGPK